MRHVARARNLHDRWRLIVPGTEQALTAMRERGLRPGVVSNADGRPYGRPETARAGLVPAPDVDANTNRALVLDGDDESLDRVRRYLVVNPAPRASDPENVAGS